MNDTNLTPAAVAAYAAQTSKALQDVHSDDLLRELTYRMTSDMRSLVSEGNILACRLISQMTEEQRREYVDTKGDILLLNNWDMNKEQMKYRQLILEVAGNK